MEVGNAVTRINHCHGRASLVDLHNCSFDLFTFGSFQAVKFGIYIAETIAYINSDFIKIRTVFCKYILIENLDALTEDIRVRDLHHGGLQVQ